jgi:hypothetical protein
LTVTVQELFAYENSTTDETTDADEVGRMQGDLIDLEPSLRDAGGPGTAGKSGVPGRLSRVVPRVWGPLGRAAEGAYP